MKIDYLISALDEAVENLAPKNVGTSIRLTATRKKLSAISARLKDHREVLLQDALETIDLSREVIDA